MSSIKTYNIIEVGYELPMQRFLFQVNDETVEAEITRLKQERVRKENVVKELKDTVRSITFAYQFYRNINF